MKAVLYRSVVAKSEDIVTCDGYQYFPSASVRMEWLEKTPKTKSDLECPHVVQFFDVVIGNVRAPRAAWAYEAPLPTKKQTAGRIGFWHEVKVE
jgi:uncharacterized protein (DUF427 family)